MTAEKWAVWISTVVRCFYFEDVFFEVHDAQEFGKLNFVLKATVYYLEDL